MDRGGGNSKVFKDVTVFCHCDDLATVLLDDLAEAVIDGARKQFMESVATVPLLIIDDFGMRKLPLTAAEDLLEIVMRRYERASTLLTSTRRGLGKTTGRCGRGDRTAGPHTASWACAQMRPAQLAHQVCGDYRRGRSVISAAALLGIRSPYCIRRGLRPCDPPKLRERPFYEVKTKAFLLPPAGRDGERRVGQRLSKSLPQLPLAR
jgi:hypothetical protein